MASTPNSFVSMAVPAAATSPVPGIVKTTNMPGVDHQQITVISALDYVNYSKISNTLLLLFSNKMFFFYWTEIHKMLVKIAKSTVPDQTSSSEAVQFGSTLFVLTLSAGI